MYYLYTEFKNIRMEYTNLISAKRVTGLSYIGKINNSTKHEKAYKYNELVYTIYLAPANSSGFEVCPGRSKECTDLCLNESGRNRHMDKNVNKINSCRIKKTQLFFTEHKFFMSWVIHEINVGITRAKKIGYRFSVRLNNTSDISPEMFFIKENGIKKNLLQLFPDVQFYDYTKVSGRVELMKKYPNYDITFSFDGYNLKQCLRMLDNNIRVAMVFKNMRESYLGFNVIDGDKYDMRYLDPKKCIVGLKYKKVRNELITKHKFVIS